MEFDWATVTSVAGVLLAGLTILNRRMDRRFDVMDRRFDAVDGRFDAVDRRFDAVDRRFDAVERRFELVDGTELGSCHRTTWAV